MTTERLIAASAVAGFILTLFVGAITGTFILGTTFATQDQVRQAVTAGIVPLATEADVAREVGSIKEDLVQLPTSDEVAALVAEAVRIGITQAIAPLATREDLAALSLEVEASNELTGALTDCIIDLEDPRVFIDTQAAVTAADPDALPGQPPTVTMSRRFLPNSCARARQLAREP